VSRSGAPGPDPQAGPGVYLIHFHTRYRHAGHYTGWAANVARRVEEHRAGKGSRLMEVITAAGIEWELARVWPGEDRRKERRLKRSGAASRYCPVCRRSPTVPTEP
jgi:predicted GIY-YIG superfamily endonuclease